MDTPLAATVHKKNVHVGGGKTFSMRKPIKINAAGKRRKALADIRDTYAPSSGVSNDVDLKPMAHGKQQIAGADPFTTKKQIAVSLDNFGIGSKPFDEWESDDSAECICSTWVISEDEKSMAHGKQQIAGADPFTTKKQIAVSLDNFGIGSKPFEEWDSDDSDECICSTWLIPEDEKSMYNFFSASKYLDSHPNDYKSLKYDDKGTYSTKCNDKVYGIEDPDLHSPMSFPGPTYTPKEICFPPQAPLYECPPLELKSEDDFGFGNDYRW